MNQNINDAYKDKQNSNQSEGNISSQDLKNDVNKHTEKTSKGSTTTGIFKFDTANNWIKAAKERPMPKPVFDSMLLEKEMCVLFADSNTGKSILAVQIADSVSRGKAIKGFSMEVEKQSILYFDFELSDKQFEIRYSMYGTNHYVFDDNFHRVELNPDDDEMEEGFEFLLFRGIKSILKIVEAKVLIIDNLTYLSLKEPEKAKNALPLMRKLQKLKREFDLTILVIAHTPKRDLARPITQNDLGGSKMLMNFFDSAFAIGKSHKDSGLRYIKQIKVRSTEERYGANNVCVCQVVKDNNFLKFEHLYYDEERNHLKPMDKGEKAEKITQVKILKEDGKTHRQIASELGISIGTVSNYLKKSE